MKPWTIALLGVAVMALIGQPVLADYTPPTPLPNELSKLGGFSSAGHGGSNPGLIGTSRISLTDPNTWGKPEGSRLGSMFDGPTWVDSFTITQTSAESRRKIETMAMYADGNFVGYITMPLDQYEQQTVYFEPVKATWITLLVLTQYGSGDANGGPTNYYFGGTPTGELDRANLNKNPLRIDVENTLGQGTDSDYGKNKANAVTDKLVGNDTANVFWEIGGLGCDTEQSMTINYNEPQTVGSVGIALAGEQGNRSAPKWVTISGYNSETDTLYSEKVFLNPLLIQYDRYDLMDENGKAVVFEDVDWLRITFPNSVPVAVGTQSERDAADSADWFLNSTNKHYGLVNFQAFAPIPEPATMTLLAMGGLAMLRRRGR